ncbi:hypothetical protein APT_10151 (plasmid) [Acetobacter pasteurianus NBRC 101655]|nr:hypothetical protein APT_10151 [Acetobacter pasteurianus NBRC 101655]
MESTVSINDIPDISCFIYRLFNYIEKLNSNKNRMHITFSKRFTIYNFFLMLIHLSCYEEDIPKDMKNYGT